MKKVILIAGLFLICSTAMAKDKSHTFSIDELVIDRTYDAFAIAYRWPATVPNPINPSQQIANPETKELHYQRKVKEFISEITAAYESAIAGEVARKAAYDKSKNEVVVK